MRATTPDWSSCNTHPYHSDVGLSPSTTSKWTKDLDDRLFVNAWDCWSMLGNGNRADNSADGFWGRSSAIALLGWPKSNPHIQYFKL